MSTAHSSARGTSTDPLQLLLFGPCQTKIRSLTDLAFFDGNGRHLLSVVLLGLLTHLLTHGGEIYGGS